MRIGDELRAHSDPHPCHLPSMGKGEDYKCIFYNLEEYTYNVIYGVSHSQEEEPTYVECII
jgi:hypothetical protein